MNNFLRLLLTSLIDFVPDYLDKYSAFSKATFEKSLEFLLYNRYNGSAPNLLFILLLVV